jgi:hypothetical protein
MTNLNSILAQLVNDAPASSETLLLQFHHDFVQGDGAIASYLSTVENLGPLTSKVKRCVRPNVAARNRGRLARGRDRQGHDARRHRDHETEPVLVRVHVPLTSTHLFGLRVLRAVSSSDSLASHSLSIRAARWSCARLLSVKPGARSGPRLTATRATIATAKRIVAGIRSSGAPGTYPVVGVAGERLTLERQIGVGRNPNHESQRDQTATSLSPPPPFSIVPLPDRGSGARTKVDGSSHPRTPTLHSIRRSPARHDAKQAVPSASRQGVKLNTPCAQSLKFPWRSKARTRHCHPSRCESMTKVLQSRSV